MQMTIRPTFPEKNTAEVIRFLEESSVLFLNGLVTISSK